MVYLGDCQFTVGYQDSVYLALFILSAAGAVKVYAPDANASYAVCATPDGRLYPLLNMSSQCLRKGQMSSRNVQLHYSLLMSIPLETRGKTSFLLFGGKSKEA